MPKAPISRLTGLDIQPDPTITKSTHGFYVPTLPTATINLLTTVATGGELRNGLITYNNTTNNYQGYQLVNAANVMVKFLTTTSAATGVGLTTGGSFTLPSGPRGNVEVAANQIAGFTYYDATNNVIRTYKGGTGWQTITSA